MYCSNCGKEIPSQGRFCPGCGKSVAAPAPVQTASEDRTLIWVLWAFFGGCGIHRFFLGGRHTTWGVIYLLTGAFCLIGWFYDLFNLSNWIDEYEYEKAYMRNQMN